MAAWIQSNYPAAGFDAKTSLARAAGCWKHFSFCRLHGSLCSVGARTPTRLSPPLFDLLGRPSLLQDRCAVTLGYGRKPLLG
jgi:hypothetical protein